MGSSSGRIPVNVNGRKLSQASIFGVASWVVGIVISTQIFGNFGFRNNVPSPDTVLHDVSNLQQIVYVFYGGHFIEVKFWHLVYDPVNVASYTENQAIATILPIILLIVSGMVFTRRWEIFSSFTGFTHGAKIFIGYLPMMVIGAVIFTYNGTGAYGYPHAIQLPIVSTVFYGLLFPVVFGGLGGLLTSSLSMRRTNQPKYHESAHEDQVEYASDSSAESQDLVVCPNCRSKEIAERSTCRFCEEPLEEA